MKRRDVIEFEVDKMEFGGTSVSRYGNRDIHMKGGITGQKVKAAVKRTKSGKADVKMLELLENSPIETELLVSILTNVEDVRYYLFLMKSN